MIDKSDLHTAVKVISEGGIVIIPTDTVYGMSCDPENPHPQDRIRNLKKRDQKPFILLDSSKERVLDYFVHYDLFDRFVDFLLTEGFWPGGITVVSEKRPHISFPFLAGLKNIAVRYTDNEIISYITESLGHGIISTSVNIAGMEPLNDYSLIHSAWSGSVDHIVKGIPGDNKVSSIIELSEKNGEIKFLRMTDSRIGEAVRRNFPEVL